MRLYLLAIALVGLGGWIAYTSASHRPVLPDQHIPRVMSRSLIVRQLEQEVSWRKVDLRIAHLPEFVGRQLEVPVVLDRPALLEGTLDNLATRLQAELTPMPAGIALSQLLAPHELTWVAERDYLLITTKTAAETRMVDGVYPVRDLVLCRDEQGELEDYDSLIDAIQQSVAPNSWRDGGMGEGTIVPVPVAGALIVHQSPAAHEEIERLLQTLRTTRDLQGKKRPPLRGPTAPQGPHRPLVNTVIPVVG